MNETIVEILAYTSIFSAIVPFAVGFFNHLRLNEFFRFALVAILVSFIFDLFATLNSLYSWNLFHYTKYFDVCAIAIWGLAYSKLFKQYSSWKSGYAVLSLIAFLIAAYTLFATATDSITNYLGANVYNLFHILSSLLLIVLYLKHIEQWLAPDLLILYSLITCLVYFSILVGVYAFFDQLDRTEMMKVYTIKWITYILFNVLFAIIFYRTSKHELK